MEFVIADRQSIERGVKVRTPYIVISISDPRKRRAKVRRQSGLRAVLRVSFHDAEPVEGLTLPKHIVIMTPKQAGQIVQFFEQHRSEIGTVVVQCEQGSSRSPAVAAALCRRLGQDDARFFRHYQPNRHVYQLVLDCANRDAHIACTDSVMSAGKEAERTATRRRGI